MTVVASRTPHGRRMQDRANAHSTRVHLPQLQICRAHTEDIQQYLHATVSLNFVLCKLLPLDAARWSAVCAVCASAISAAL